MHATKPAARYCERNQALTAAEVIELLQEAPPNAIVMFTCDYGDRGRTKQLLPVTEVTVPQEESWLMYESAYSNSGIAIQECDEDNFNEEDILQVEAVVLNLVQ